MLLHPWGAESQAQQSVERRLREKEREERKNEKEKEKGAGPGSLVRFMGLEFRV